MRKGPKIIIGIIIAIVIIIVAGFGVYYFSFKPSVSTTPVSAVTEAQINSVTQKFNPQNIAQNATNLGNGKKQVSLTPEDLSNVAAYAVSKEPSVAKYVTGVTVQPENNNQVAVYVTGKLKGVSSQAKLNFNILNENGQTTLQYDGGKVGFISIPQSELFEKLHDNNYITVNKQNGTIVLNPNLINGEQIDSINANSANLNVILNALGQN
ncbi:MAG: hypothetical protein ACRCX8_16355 [Sarcina sp.]